MHFAYINVIKKTLEKTRFKTLLFYTYHENHLLFVYLHLYIFSLIVHFNKKLLLAVPFFHAILMPILLTSFSDIKKCLKKAIKALYFDLKYTTDLFFFQNNIRVIVYKQYVSSAVYTNK